jgi:hypothetical protein
MNQMDPQVLPLKDSALIVLAAATQTANATSATFDLALGATLVNGQFTPGAGGAAMNMLVPVNSYNAADTITLTATGGTYTISVQTGNVANGNVVTNTTTALAYNANAAAIAAAVGALANVGASNVTVTGAGPFTVTLAPSLGVANLTVGTGSLTGGSATAATPTYSVAINESPDGSTWQAASRVATVLTDNISPAGGILQVEFTAKWRYIQLVLTVGGTAPSIVLQDSYITPFVNRFGG